MSRVEHGGMDGWQELKAEVRGHFARFDEWNRAWLETHTADGGRIYCRCNCQGCCTLAVNVTLGEALCIAGKMNHAQDAALERHVPRLLEIARMAPDLASYLRLHRQQAGGCPLLTAEGACGVYAERPFACRALFSTRPSAYCATDFSEMHPLEKHAFLSSLDPSVVAFPTHYAGTPREQGRELESGAAHGMRARCGFSMGGNLPFLLWLIREHDLPRMVMLGREAVASGLEKEGLLLPFLVIFD